MTRYFHVMMVSTIALFAIFGTWLFSQAIAASERPLGMLIAPDDVTPTASEPQIQPVEPSKKPPLGILIGRETQNLSETSPVDPVPVKFPISYSRKPIVHLPLDGQTYERPLGLLIKSETNVRSNILTTSNKFLDLGKISSFNPPKTDNLKPPFNVPLTSDVSKTRPLGTLFGPTNTYSSTQSSIKSLSSPALTPVHGANRPSSPFSGVRVLDTKTGKINDKIPASFSADTLSFDPEKNSVNAQGNVELIHGQRTLRADRVIYDQKADVISAVGNVILSEPSGELLLGDKMGISGDLKDALVHNIGLVLQDKSRIAGNKAKRTAGKVTELHNAVYSPCKLCEDNPDAPPLWQIKAVKVSHDKDQQTIEYRDAWLEFFGVPAFYTPYFRHPDPSVRRKSGFLFPSIGSSSDFGTIVATPYFWAISRNEDMTIEPIFMSNATPILSGQYRNRVHRGELNIDSSITDDTGDLYSTDPGTFGLRGHIISNGRFNINRTWRWGFNLERTSDDTYIRRFGFGNPSSLDSQLFVEGFRNQNYFSAKTQLFQGLQESDDQDTTPIVLPLIDYNYTGTPDNMGGRTLFDLNVLALTRSQGTDTRRLSMHPKWERVFQDNLGGQLNFSAGLNGDFYHTNGLIRDSDNVKFSGFSHRFFPFTNLQWQIPLVKTHGTTQQILEPIVSAGIAPNGGNPDDIPNEDSTDFEFDETNLFSINRFSGLDRVQGGSRMNYGLKWGLFGSRGGSTTAFIGQSYRPRKDSTFVAGSGLEDNFSDIVTSASISPGSFLNVLYQARLDADNFSPNRNEISVQGGVPAITINAQYTSLETQQDSEFSGREELNVGATSNIDRNWRTAITAVRDLESSEMRSTSLDAIYETECVIITSNVSRTFFEDRDLKPTDAITVHLVLKTLGEVKGSTNISSN